MHALHNIIPVAIAANNVTVYYIARYANTRVIICPADSVCVKYVQQYGCHWNVSMAMQKGFTAISIDQTHISTGVIELSTRLDFQIKRFSYRSCNWYLPMHLPRAIGLVLTYHAAKLIFASRPEKTILIYMQNLT